MDVCYVYQLKGKLCRPPFNKPGFYLRVLTSNVMPGYELSINPLSEQKQN